MSFRFRVVLVVNKDFIPGSELEYCCISSIFGSFMILKPEPGARSLSRNVMAVVREVVAFSAVFVIEKPRKPHETESSHFSFTAYPEHSISCPSYSVAVVLKSANLFNISLIETRLVEVFARIYWTSWDLSAF